MSVVERERWTRLQKAELVGRLRDTLAWPTWSPMASAVVVQPGIDGPSSPGEIRIFASGSVTGREQVLPNTASTVLRYRLLAGMPLRDYVGEVEIQDLGGWRKIVWRSSFRAAVPFTGWMFSFGLGAFFDRILDGLVGTSRPVAAPGRIVFKVPEAV